MKVKSLILGASPVAGFESSKVVIDDARIWTVKVTTTPVVNVSREVELEVVGSDGAKITTPVLDGLEISGASVHARFLKEISGIKNISIILESK